MAVSLAASGCASSPPSSETPGLGLSRLPGIVYAEAAKPVPSFTQDTPAEEVATALQVSAKDKQRALKAAIRAHEKQREYIANRGKPKKKGKG